MQIEKIGGGGGGGGHAEDINYFYVTGLYTYGNPAMLDRWTFINVCELLSEHMS